jgi:hypothetical protein
MKVYEILIETKGWIGIFSRMLPDSTQKLVAGELESALAWASRRLKGQPIDVASKDLAESWITASSKSGIPLDDIIALGEAEAKKLKISPQVIANAKAQAAVLKKAGDDAAAAVARGGIGKQSLTALGSLADTVIKWGTVWGIAEPLYNCSTKISRAYELNKSGDPEWQGQKLHGAIQFYLDDCVAEVGAILAARTISIAMFKVPSWFLPAPALSAMKKYTPPGIQNIYQTIAGMSKVAEAAWIAWIGTPQGREWLARFLVSGSLIASPFALVQQIVGGWVKKGYDAVADQLVDPAQRSEPAPPTQYQGAKKSGIDPATGNRIR